LGVGQCLVVDPHLGDFAIKDHAVIAVTGIIAAIAMQLPVE
jgi:hypothetical protein